MHMAEEDMDPREFSNLVHLLLLLVGSISFVIKQKHHWITRFNYLHLVLSFICSNGQRSHDNASPKCNKEGNNNKQRFNHLKPLHKK